MQYHHEESNTKSTYDERIENIGRVANSAMLLAAVNTMLLVLAFILSILKS